MAIRKLSTKLQDWVTARKRHHLSHAHVQMARELGLNPKKLGKLANHDQEPWKLTLQDFIVKLYMKHFGRERPETIRSIEEIAAAKQAKKQAKKAPDPPYRSSRNRIPLRKTRCRMSRLNAQLRNSSKFGVLGDWGQKGTRRPLNAG
jgi:hypothetical protein